jgi:hypothetical protein
MESATITELRQRPVTPPTGGWPEGTGEIAIATATEPGDLYVAMAVFKDGEHIGYVLTRPEYGEVVWRPLAMTGELRPADWHGTEFVAQSRAEAIIALLEKKR